MVVTDGKVDLDSEALLIRLKMLLSMEPVMTGSVPMKKDLKTAADEPVITGSMPMERRSMRISS
jgi:hypothetical protein